MRTDPESGDEVVTKGYGLAESSDGMVEAGVPSPAARNRLALAQFLLDVIGQCQASDVTGLLSHDVVFELSGPGTLSERASGREATFRALDQLANRVWLSMGGSWEDWLVGESHVAALGGEPKRPAGLTDSVREEVLFTFEPGDAISNIQVNLRSCP